MPARLGGSRAADLCSLLTPHRPLSPFYESAEPGTLRGPCTACGLGPPGAQLLRGSSGPLGSPSSSSSSSRLSMSSLALCSGAPTPRLCLCLCLCLQHTARGLLALGTSTGTQWAGMEGVLVPGPLTLIPPGPLLHSSSLPFPQKQHQHLLPLGSTTSVDPAALLSQPARPPPTCPGHSPSPPAWALRVYIARIRHEEALKTRCPPPSCDQTGVRPFSPGCWGPAVGSVSLPVCFSFHFLTFC